MLKQVLIADDNCVVRRMVREFFEERGDLQVCGEAANGVEVLEKAKELRPDLVLLDLVMPEMNGAEAATALKKLMPNMPIILFTMYGSNIRGSRNHMIDADLVISKGDGMVALASAVDILLSRQADRPDSKGSQHTS
jgi:two-component system chemotaxis response regulator CheY